MAKDDLTKKEQEYLDILNKDGQVILDDVDEKDMKKLAKKLEKIYGEVNPPVVG